MTRETGDENDLWFRVQWLTEEIQKIKSRLALTHAGGRLVASSILGNVAPASLVGPTVQMFINNSGGSLADGDVVVLDASGARLIGTTTTPADELSVGVVRDVRSQGPFAATAETPVLILGNLNTLKVTGAVAAGDYLAASSTIKRAESVGTSSLPGAFAIAESANPSGDGTVAAFVFGFGGASGSGGGSGRFYIPFGSDVDGQI